MAGEFVQHLKSQENDRKIFGNTEEETSISLEEEWCVRLAGLCHDLGEVSCTPDCGASPLNSVLLRWVEIETKKTTGHCI